MADLDPERFTLRIMLGSAVLNAALVIGWIEVFWRHCL
jgi:hypothetical protein